MIGELSLGIETDLVFMNNVWTGLLPPDAGENSWCAAPVLFRPLKRASRSLVSQVTLNRVAEIHLTMGEQGALTGGGCEE